jgi:hypothetical protein
VSEQRHNRQEHLLRMELAQQGVIDNEFRQIAESFEVWPPRRPWPIRAVVTFFRTLNGLRQQF